MSEQTQNPNPQANLREPGANNVLEPGRNAFRERKRQQLSETSNQPATTDRGDAMPNLNQTELQQTDVPQDVRQPDYRDQPLEPSQETGNLEETFQPPALDAPTGIENELGAELLQPDVDEPPADAVDWQSRYNEAEELRGNMQSDYQRKTMKLADDRRELKRGFEVQTQVSAAYVQRADQALSKWQNVDWQGLRRTLDPAEYNQRVNQYKQVANQSDNAKQNHQALVDFAGKTLDEQKTSEAEISKDILKNTIPKWGNELYGNLRNHAVESLGYTPAEFDEVTDHKLIALVYGDLMRATSGRTVQGLTKNPNQRPPNGANLPQRSASGKFTNSKSAWLENPGERGRARDHFTEKLRREREGR